LPRLVYRTSALRDLANIASFIEHESSDRNAAIAFIKKLTDYCEHLATLPGLMGRPRPELRPYYRSTTFGSYVIFLRYADDDGPRSHLYVVNVIHGARDIDAYFAAQPDDDAV
jgi:plasmid stabilization system protein ParE